MRRRGAIAIALLLALAGAARAQEAAAGEEAAEGEGEHGEHGAPPVNFTDFGWSHKDAHGGTLEKGEEPMAPPFILALLNFAALLTILGKFAVPKIRGLVRDRHDEIVNALDEAARLRDQARRKLEECALRVSGLDAEVSRLVAEIRAQAEAVRRDAELRITAELARARVTLEREVVAAAIAAAEKLLRAQTGEADQRNLVQQFIASLEAAHPAAREPS